VLNIFVSLNLFSNLQNIWVKLLDFCRFKMAYNGFGLCAGRVFINLFYFLAVQGRIIAKPSPALPTVIA